MGLYFGLLYAVDEVTYGFRIIDSENQVIFPDEELNNGIYINADLDPTNLQRVLLNRLETYQGRKIILLGRETILAEMEKYRKQQKSVF